MPHRARKHQSRRARILNKLTRNIEERSAAVCDVTLNDFANCEVKRDSSGGGRGVRRLKKGNVTTAMKKLSVVNDNDDRPWDERDDDDGDDGEHVAIQNGEGNGDGVNGEDGGGQTLHTTRDHKRRRRRRLVGKTEEEEEEEGGADYPLDLWFLISDYIRPEDVGRFACLCQATHYISTTVRFWLSMFRRHYQWSATLPDSLNYWNLDNKVKDVRVCVIRALFLMYAPFCARLAAEKPLSADPTQLLRAQCILQWHEKAGTQHKYFFKFAHPEHSVKRKRSLWKCVGDASAYCNPHSGCWVLEATSVGVCAVPMVMGEYLYHAGLGVSANLCNHVLRLSFVPSHLLPSSAKASTRRHQVPATEMTLDPVSNVRLYPWWHPQYWKVLEISHSTDKDDW